MKRTYVFVQPVGTVPCDLPDGSRVDIPVVPGILKNPSVDALGPMLQNPDVLRKYTHEALRRAPWEVVRRFPRAWLLECIPTAALTPGRRKALLFLLGAQ